MKSLLVYSLALVGWAVSAQGSILGRFDFNDLSSVQSINEAGIISPCVDLSSIEGCGCGLNEGLHTAGGPDGSAFRTYSGWDVNQYDATVYLNRSGLWQWPRTLSFEVQAAADSQGGIEGLSVDLRRPYANSPDTIMASIFWQDDLGVVQQRNSGPVDIASAMGWTTIDFDFTDGSAPLPMGPAFSGETFNVELYAWGGDGAALYLDNVTLTGDCAPIPEPDGALLIGIAGLVLIFRRRLP